MTIFELETPAVLLDLDVMEDNLLRYAEQAARYGKQLWPMVKTHKSLALAAAQARAGASGFLCGTLDEAEALAAAGFENLMYAYPVATDVSIRRVIRLAKACRLTVRTDSVFAAEKLNAAAEAEKVFIPYTIIVDSGLHRFGIRPQEAGAFALTLKKLEHLVFKGVSTHPGHVYAASSAEDLPAYCADERAAIRTADAALREAGFTPEILSSGSTPTFRGTIADERLNVYHPGNYIFNDVIQISTQTAAQAQCALSVLTSVISHPGEDLFLCDAGAKCLGLDQGAHGNQSIRGHGLVVGHPELTVDHLSEEVGKLRAEGETDVRIGDKLRIIPNHACSTANLTSFYVAVRGDHVERLIPVDIRGNLTTKGAC